MGRSTIFVGTQIQGTVPDTASESQVSWPDLDINGTIADIVGQNKFDNVKAIALAASTDWDLVRVVTKAGAIERVGPGRLLVLNKGDTIARIEPVMTIPPTRPYNGTLQRGQQQPPATSAWAFDVSTGYVRNVGAVTLQTYKWSGSAWVAFSTVASGATLISSVGPTLTVQGAPLNERATDYSPDGVWSFADYAWFGSILNADGSSAKGVSFVGSKTLGNLGTPGDLTDPTTIKFAFAWGGLNPFFFGRLALDVFDSDCPDWAPRLPSQRQLTLPAITLPNGGGAGPPNTAIVTLPAFNVSAVEFCFKNDSATSGVYACWVTPSAISSYSSLDGVTETDGTSTYDTVAPSSDGSVVLENVRHPLVKLLLGSQAGQTLAAGGVITLTRRFTQ